MNYIKQVLYELKNQKMMTLVSVSGTALSIFLIMAIFMASRLKQLEIPPLSDRDRILTAMGIDFSTDQGSSGSGMGIDYDLAKKLYCNLDGIEKESFVKLVWGKIEAGQPRGETYTTDIILVDDEFWNIYDYKFISGKPFDNEEIKSQTNLAILTKSMAHKIFGEEDVAGRMVDIENIPYRVKGVIDDQYPMLPDAKNGIFLSFTPGEPNQYYMGIFGNVNLRLLLKEGVSPDHIKKQVAKRYEDLNREYESENKTFTYHKQPYTYDELNMGSFGSNNDPPVKSHRIEMFFYYGILLLLPAINLSSMTRSRLHHRISEIGVRRAFGAKKRNIISQIFTENLILSLGGGIIGLFFSLLFLLFMSGYVIAVYDIMDGGSLQNVSIAPVVWHIFDWKTFFIAIGACFVLNLLSATLPSWKAASVKPAIAIAKTR